MGNRKSKPSVKEGDSMSPQLFLYSISVTKRDIAQDYDLTIAEQVSLANAELIESFSEFSEEKKQTVLQHLFTLQGKKRNEDDTEVVV